MVVNEIKCKSILNKSKLPEVDYCINPYVGCLHSCVYCYARFMKRFTSHTEEWGDFLDIKINATEVLEKELSKKQAKGTILFGSVTDAYQPIERKYEITRSILEMLVNYDFSITILTKSDLVVRDIDLLKQFADCEVGLTITTLEKSVASNFEPYASSPKAKLKALSALQKAGIKTYVFIGPVLPNLTDLRSIYEAINGKVDFVMVEALNLKCGNLESVRALLEKKYPNLLPLYIDGFNKEYWDKVEKEARSLSKEFNIPLKGFYKH